MMGHCHCPPEKNLSVVVNVKKMSSSSLTRSSAFKSMKMNPGLLKEDGGDKRIATLKANTLAKASRHTVL